MMYHSARRGWGCAALTLLFGGLAATGVQASSPPLSPFLFQPTFLAMAFQRSAGQSLLPASLQTRGLTLTSSLPAAAPPWTDPVSQSPVFAQPMPLAAAWLPSRRSDPSLHLADWRQVLDVDRLGVFVIPLRSDPAERTNILLSAQAVDNTVVPAGGVFSFNQTVGERTPEKGYQDGLMFSQGQLIRGTGGGICLVATGLYNAALQAGLALVERHPHSGIVGYAPPGCDASVVYGAEDMQFQNTTDAPVIVKTDIQDDRIVVGLYGKTPPAGRHVFVKDTHLAYIHAPVIEKPDPTMPPAAPPVVVQKPRLGFDVTVERVITQGAQVLQRETVVSEHRAPRPKIVRVPVAAPVSAPASGDTFSFQPFGLLTAPAQSASGPALVPLSESPVRTGEGTGGTNAGATRRAGVGANPEADQ